MSMLQPFDTPEEDKNLCDHVFKDLYGGEGTDKHNPDIALNAFYCEKCLLIRVKAWPQHRYYRRREWLEEYHEDTGDGNATTL